MSAAVERTEGNAPPRSYAGRRNPQSIARPRFASIAGRVACLAGLLAAPLQAVLFHSTDNPEYNTTAPTDALAESGWQLQGFWGAYLGTPISSNLFLTAQHVGGQIGQSFFLNGVAYTTTAFFDDAETDLRLVRVCGTLPAVAVLHTNQTEPGKPLVVFGRGTRRGVAVTTGDSTIRTNGWRWGLFDSRLRWGENQVESVADGNELFGSGTGELLTATFDADGGVNECHLSLGDSAGGLFILEDDGWQLAGINLAVDGPYRTSAEGPEFEAAIFDEGGLFRLEGDEWIAVPTRPFNQPGSFYATRVSSRISWIQSVIAEVAAQPELPTLQFAADPAGPFEDHPSANVAAESALVTFPRPESTQFYRLRGCQTFRIIVLEILDSAVRLRYEPGDVGSAASEVR